MRSGISWPGLCTGLGPRGSGASDCGGFGALGLRAPGLGVVGRQASEFLGFRAEGPRASLPWGSEA